LSTPSSNFAARQRAMSNTDADVCCSHCSAPGAGSRCGNCLETIYCGRECQRAHWRAGHKAHCEASVARLKARSAGVFGAGAAPASALSVRELQEALRARGVSTAGLLEKCELVQALERAQAQPAAPAPPPPPPREVAHGKEADAAAHNLAMMAEGMQRHAAQSSAGSKFAGLMGKAARDSIAAAQGMAAAGGGSGGGSGGGGSGSGSGSGSGGSGGRTAILTGGGLVDAGELDTSSPLTRAELLDLCTRQGRPSRTAGDAMVYGLLWMRLLASAEGDKRAADWTVSYVKSAEGRPPGTIDFLMTLVLDEHGTTHGLTPRVTALRETIEEEMRRHGLVPRP
jgi:hypothetical protein